MCELDTISGLVGKVEKRARKPWITQEMISKMDERRKRKNVNIDKRRKNYRRLKNELERATDRAKKEYFEIFRRRIEKKIENVFRNQFGFRTGKGTRGPTVMLRIISERTLELDEELCVCFIDWQKAFDRVNWTKLMQILKGTGIDRCERRLTSNVYMAPSVKVRLNPGETRSVKIGRGVRQGCCVTNSVQLVWRMSYKEALEGFGDFKIGEKIIHTVKYADHLVLLAKEEKVLQDIIDKLIEILRCYGMEMNVEKTKVMRISRQPFPVKL